MIREYSHKDYPAVYKIYRESFGLDFTERLLKDHLFTSDAVWVYEMLNNEVIGYLLSEKLSTPYLSQVAVLDRYRKLGVATKLINKFESHYESKGNDSVWLQVKVENPSQKLYFDLGYRVTKFESNLYGHEKHGLRMDKSFK
jgi:ribosomal protein S18 acetylase RimI-like enzyme